MTNYVRIGTAILVLLAVLFIVFLLLSVKRRNRLTMQAKEREIKFQQELLQAQLEIQEQTLKTISEEIHDNIGQVLSLAKLKLNTVDTAKETELREKITDSKNLVSKAIQDLRDLSRSLNTDNIASMGLQRAIEHELELIRKSGYETIFEINGESRRMEPQKELIVFRILQESLNNIIKHADARKIAVRIHYSGDKLELKIQDDGKGTDLELLAGENDNKSLGLRNMRNRAQLIGAGFQFDSEPGKGTTIYLSIPLKLA